MAELMNSDAAFVRFIESFWDENGYAPTVREICDALGYKSPSTVWLRLRNLREQGIVSYKSRIPRTVRVIQTAFEI